MRGNVIDLAVDIIIGAAFTGVVNSPAPAAAPLFGQHSDEILAAYGYSAADIAALRGRCIIG